MTSFETKTQGVFLVIALIALAVLFFALSRAHADPVRWVRPYNMGSPYPNWYVQSQAREAAKIVRRAAKRRLLVRPVLEIPDPFQAPYPTTYEDWKAPFRGYRFNYYRTLHPAFGRSVNAFLYTSPYGTFAVNSGRECGLSLTSMAPHEFIKLALAHELGHILGASHDSRSLNIMHPYWDVFLAQPWPERPWRFNAKARREMRHVQR